MEELDEVLADAATELRGIEMYELASGVERARRLLVPPASGVHLIEEPLTPEQLRFAGVL